MRGKPRATEKLIGALVLVLTGLLVLVFLLTGGLFKGFVESHPTLARIRNLFGISEKPLFVAEPENLPAPTAPRQVRVAQSLLPASLGGDQLPGGDVRAIGLRTPEDVQAAQHAGLDPEFVKAAQGANARWVYAREYGAGNPAGVRVHIADLGEPAAALKAWESRQPKESRAVAIGRGGWLADGHAGFWAGRYYTEVWTNGEASPAIESLARSLSGMQLAYGGRFVDTTPQADSQPVRAAPTGAGPGPARFAEVPGGRLAPPTKIDRYAENLYEKIDGKESAFRSFSVVDLKFGQYADPDTQQTYDVYIYDMAQPINAMGIYMSERAPSAAALELGREGYVSGTSVFFWKGQYYVNVLGPSEGGDQALDNAKQIASAIAGSIADAGEPFWAEKVLPAEDRVPNSLSYQASSALGYEFLQRMYFARYDAGGKKLQMYVTKAADAQSAKSMYERFAESTAKFDKVVAREDLAGGQMFVSETVMPGRPSKFGAAFSKGPYFAGVYDADGQALAISKAKALFESLSADDPGDPEAAAAAAESSSDEGDGGHGEPTEGESESSEGEGGESGQ